MQKFYSKQIDVKAYAGRLLEIHQKIAKVSKKTKVTAFAELD